MRASISGGLFRRRARWCLWAAVAVALAATAAPAHGASREALLDARATQRRDRQQADLQLAHARAHLAPALAHAIADLLQQAQGLSVRHQHAPLEALIAGLARLDPAAARPLATATAALPPEPGHAEPALQARWESLLHRTRATALAPLRRLAQQAIDTGAATAAVLLLADYEVCNPEDATLQHNLGLTLVDHHWYGPHELALVQRGWAWDDGLGWILAAQRARYGTDRYLDLATGTWQTRSDADAAHATIQHGWQLRTEHLEVDGNAPLARLVACAEHLERFDRQLFGVYPAFFQARHHPDLRTILGMADREPLLVHIERTHADYVQALGVPAGWSRGMFVPGPGRPAAFFTMDEPVAMDHEFTHQILGVYAGRNAAPAWLVEGAAIYAESPSWDHGVLVLPHACANPHLQGYVQDLARGRDLPLTSLWSLTSYTAWSAASDPIRNYNAAGAFAAYAMDADHHRFRDDFVDFLRDAYAGDTQGLAIWDYCGVGREAMIAEFDHWVRTELRQQVQEAPAGAEDAPATGASEPPATDAHVPRLFGEDGEDGH